MCGRFTKFIGWKELFDLYSEFLDAGSASNAPPRYNITPTQDVEFVAKRDGQYLQKSGRWWLVPHWAKELQHKYPMFNARSEDAENKPAFRDAYKYGRCIIFADGYYEWTKNPDDGGKDPHFIHLPDRKPFGFAGLWSHNKTLDITSCTILTAPAQGHIKDVHHRMPIVLKEAFFDEWMDLGTSVEDAKTLLEHHRGEEFLSYRVGREVNSNKAEGAALVVPLWEDGVSPIPI